MEQKEQQIRQTLRFYVRHDLDLLNLKLYDVPLSKLGRTVLEAYANNKYISYKMPLLDEDKTSDKSLLEKIINEKVSLKNNGQNQEISAYRCTFITRDPNAIKVLNSLKTNYRNQFIKTLIRNCLTRPSLIQFYKKDGEMLELEKNYIRMDQMKPEMIEEELPTKDDSVDMDKVLQSSEERKKNKKKQNIVISDEKEKIEMPVQEKIMAELQKEQAKPEILPDEETETREIIGVQTTENKEEVEEVVQSVIQSETEINNILDAFSNMPEANL